MLTFPYPTYLNDMYRHGRRSVYLSEETRNFKDTVRWMCKALHLEPSTGPVAVTVRLYRPRKAGDIDGPLKPLLDAMEGGPYVNDKQIVQLYVFLYDDKANPRVEVDVECV